MHKPSLSWRKYGAFLFLLIAVVIYSCRKDNSSSLTTQADIALSDAQLIAKAKIYFDSSMVGNSSSNKQAANYLSPIEGREKNINWEEAYTYVAHTGKMVMLPVRFKKQLYAQVGQQKLLLDNLTRLFVYTGKSGKKHIEVVTRIPDEAYLNNPAKNKPFSGIVKVNDWQGNFIKAYRFTGGKIISLGAPDYMPINKNNKVESAYRKNDIFCYSIPFGEYNYSGDYTYWVTSGYETHCYGSGGSGGYDQDQEFDEHDYGQGGETGDGDTTPQQNRQQELSNVLQQDEKFLLDCDSLNLLETRAYQSYGSMYQQVAQFTPSQAIKDRIASLRLIAPNIIDNFNLQNLDDAFGAVVNSDFFPVRIGQMPPGMTATSLTEYFRTHLNDFITTGEHFTPYVTSYVNDTNWFNQPGAASVGALVHIKLLNDGTVVESDYQISANAASFKFSTMTSPLDYNHPVSGNREFGVYTDPNHPGQFTFYTMGVDRASDWQFALGNPIIKGFDKADALWANMQQQMINYINAHGGQAGFYDNKHTIARPDWDAVKEYLQGEIDLVQLKQKLGC